jgi:hypothetical protein
MEGHHKDRMRPRLVHYDAVRRRLWIAGQRCHHGAFGVLCAGSALTAAITGTLAPAAGVALAAGGGALMLHDWADRSLWFQAGWQSQP